MSIQEVGSGLGKPTTFKPDNFIEEQRKREVHYIISLMMHNDWSGRDANGRESFFPGQQNRKLSKLAFPQARIVAIETINYPTRNTFQDMTGTASAAEKIMLEKTAHDQVDEIVKGFDGFGVFSLEPLLGVNNKLVALIERAILPTTTEEKDYCYNALKTFFTGQAVKNILGLDYEKLEETADRTRLQLLEHLEVCYRYARKHVADADSEIGKAKAGRGGKYAYDDVDLMMMKFLDIKESTWKFKTVLLWMRLLLQA